jgi:hypothetical protein
MVSGSAKRRRNAKDAFPKAKARTEHAIFGFCHAIDIGRAAQAL